VQLDRLHACREAAELEGCILAAPLAPLVLTVQVKQ
jgi:hypothetical protein